MILNCKILCIDRHAAENNLPAEELWMKFSVDLERVIAIKEDTMPETLKANPNNSVLFMDGGTSFIINIPYEKLSEFWVNGNGDMPKREKELLGYEASCSCNAPFTGGIVLDIFAGSGTTLKVAKEMGRNFIGIELNPEYIEIAEARLKPYLEQERLAI